MPQFFTDSRRTFPPPFTGVVRTAPVFGILWGTFLMSDLFTILWSSWAPVAQLWYWVEHAVLGLVLLVFYDVFHGKSAASLVRVLVMGGAVSAFLGAIQYVLSSLGFPFAYITFLPACKRSSNRWAPPGVIPISLPLTAPLSCRSSS